MTTNQAKALEALQTCEAFLLSAGFKNSDAYQETCAAIAALESELSKPAEKFTARVREVCAESLRAGPGVAVPIPADVRAEMTKFMAGEPSAFDELSIKSMNALAAIADEPAASAQPAGEQVQWGVDWGRNGDRSCVSILKKHPDGSIEVVACEYEPAPEGQR